MTNLPATLQDAPVLFARSPEEMAASQHELVAWMDHKIAAIEADCKDIRQNYEIARKAGWRSEPWKRRLAREGKKALFYRKIKMAIEAGYYIIPAFPLDLFAIRTKRRAPSPRELGEYARHDQPAMALAPGDGNYVSPIPFVRRYTRLVKKRKFGTQEVEEVEIGFSQPTEFDDVSFPFFMAKPEILTETAKAMALKVFDQLGVMQPTVNSDSYGARDPIVAGQILSPKSQWSSPVTFFIAWWLGFEDL